MDQNLQRNNFAQQVEGFCISYFAALISVDDNILTRKFFFLENFAVTYDTDTLFVSDTLKDKILISCGYR